MGYWKVKSYFLYNDANVHEYLEFVMLHSIEL